MSEKELFEVLNSPGMQVGHEEEEISQSNLEAAGFFYDQITKENRENN